MFRSVACVKKEMEIDWPIQSAPAAHSYAGQSSRAPPPLSSQINQRGARATWADPNVLAARVRSIPIHRRAQFDREAHRRRCQRPHRSEIQTTCLPSRFLSSRLGMMARRPAAGFPDGGANDVCVSRPIWDSAIESRALAPVRRLVCVHSKTREYGEKGSLLHRPPAGLLCRGGSGRGPRPKRPLGRCVSRQAGMGSSGERDDGPARRIDLFAAAAAHSRLVCRLPRVGSPHPLLHHTNPSTQAPSRAGMAGAFDDEDGGGGGGAEVRACVRG